MKFTLAALVCLLALAVASSAAADPIIALPPEGKGVLRKQPEGPGLFALTGDVSGIGVLGSERLTRWPSYGSIEGQEPELGLARVGLLGVHDRWPIAGVLRVDFSEALRVDWVDFESEPLAAVDRFLDDAALWWKPASWAEVVAGRQRVPFSRFRQLDVSRLQAGAAPFLIDRVAPDRRWGAALHGDLGALSYVLGGFEDVDALEMRALEKDPSMDGRGLMAFHAEWTPRAPMGDDHLATPSADPWFETVRVSAGVGLLYRIGRGGRDRLDAALSGQMKWRQLSAITEVVLSSDAGEASTGIAAQLGALVTDKISLYSRSELDREASMWSVGWGLAFFASEDRRSKVGIYGWLRRDTGASAIRRDGVIVQLQAGL